MRKYLLLPAMVALLVVSALWWLRKESYGEFSSAPRAVGDSVSAADSTLETPLREAGTESPALADSSRSAVPASDPRAVGATTETCTIEVLALNGLGQPVADASASIEFGDSATFPALGLGMRSRNESVRAPTEADVSGEKSAVYVTTDARGLATFRVLDESLRNLYARIEVSTASHSAREVLIPRLTSRRVTLVLLSRARVEVAVLDETGKPRAGVFVDCQQLVELNPLNGTSRASRTPTYAKTNELGIAVFAEMLDGDFEFSYTNPRTNITAAKTLKLELGGNYALELQPGADPSQQLCISGSVADESGNPLAKIQVRLRIDDGSTVAILSDAEGMFGYSCAAGRDVDLSVGGGMFDDDFEPSSLQLPFGSRNVRLRRVRQLEVFSLEIRCLDATTGEVLPGKHLSGVRYRASAPKTGAQFQFFSNGSASLRFKSRDDWHLAISGFGYLPQDVALADAVPVAVDRKEIVIRLERAPDYESQKGSNDEWVH